MLGKRPRGEQGKQIAFIELKTTPGADKEEIVINDDDQGLELKSGDESIIDQSSPQKTQKEFKLLNDDSVEIVETTPAVVNQMSPTKFDSQVTIGHRDRCNSPSSQIQTTGGRKKQKVSEGHNTPAKKTTEVSPMKDAPDKQCGAPKVSADDYHHSQRKNIEDLRQVAEKAEKRLKGSMQHTDLDLPSKGVSWAVDAKDS